MVEVKRRFKVKDLIFISAGAALIAVCSWITVPLPTVPITLQTFAIFAVLGILGGWRGTASVAVYLALGACGVPVFSGFSGGISSLLGVTGGYLIGFIFSAGFYWAVTAGFKNSVVSRIVGMIGGLLLCYAFGTAWFVAVYTSNNGPISVGSALMTCVVPFILPDAVKLALAFTVSSALKGKVRL